ncbi:DUF3499 domain-containing protein, partial [Streptomyces sp. SM8]
AAPGHRTPDPAPRPAPDPQLPATRRAHLRVLRSPDS